ncbi:N-acetylmuramoyl-L-alanine amidase [Pararhodospirillum oryzae]|uniref:N-acetylmuramoyl-L-alanine amidase n=1 Tax=Pararhodospirillum oryzae TaxID=478448 RepID=A0A512H652_9PROT|nr:N-acetylmuramoyl-L-alanine amidase [Pararhodospirillum oryzae]
MLGSAPILAAGVLVPRAARAAVQATGVRLGDHGATTRVVMDLSDRVVWRTFAVADPPRLILDLSETTFPASLPRGAGVIKALRTGPGESGLSRVVIDLARPAVVDKDFLLEPQGGHGWRLVLDLTGVDRNAFLATVGRVPAPVVPQTLTPAPSTRAASAPVSAEPASGGLASASGVFPTPSAPAGAGSGPVAPVAPMATTGPVAPMATTGPVDLRPRRAAGATASMVSYEPASDPTPIPATYTTTPAPPAGVSTPPASMAPPAPVPPAGAPAAASGAGSPFPGGDASPVVSREGPVMVRLADGRRVPVPASKPPRTLAAQPGRRPVIVLDPGHGGRDPGTIAPDGLYEKEITLTMARELRKMLEETGRYRVVLTRSNDTAVQLRERVALGRQAEGDLFISLHADAMHDPGVRGLSVYTLSETASDAEAAALADRENKADILLSADLSQQSPDVATILIDLAQRATMNNSALFATTLLRNLPGDVRRLYKPLRSAGFAVLKAPDVPSVLIEMGFLSNAADEKLLRTVAYRSKLAQAITQSIDDYAVLQQQRAWRP